MQRFFIWVEYDGRPFLGWQRQKEGLSVQGVLENAIAQFDPRSGDQREILVYGSGRTDAGVHGIGQVAHVDIMRPMTAKKLFGALNHLSLPHPVTVTKVVEVDPDSHARFHAVQRHYVYQILNRRANPTFESGLVWHVKGKLDIDKMQEAANLLIGTHDFTTFRHAHCQGKTPIKTLDYLNVSEENDRVYIHTGARSFLHHQVRSMTGCLVQVGLGRWTVDDFRAARDAKDRQALIMNAPPDGLYFKAIDFADGIIPNPSDNSYPE